MSETSGTTDLPQGTPVPQENTNPITWHYPDVTVTPVGIPGEFVELRTPEEALRDRNDRISALEMSLITLERQARSEIAALFHRINALESQDRVHQALIVDLRLAVKGLQKQ